MKRRRHATHLPVVAAASSFYRQPCIRHQQHPHNGSSSTSSSYLLMASLLLSASSVSCLAIVQQPHHGRYCSTASINSSFRRHHMCSLSQKPGSAEEYLSLITGSDVENDDGGKTDGDGVNDVDSTANMSGMEVVNGEDKGEVIGAKNDDNRGEDSTYAPSATSTSTIEDWDDDDYAMSVLTPVREEKKVGEDEDISTTTSSGESTTAVEGNMANDNNLSSSSKMSSLVNENNGVGVVVEGVHPNEEAPPVDGAAVEDAGGTTPTLYADGKVKASKFVGELGDVTVAASTTSSFPHEKDATTTTATPPQDNTTESTNQQSIGSLLRNFWGGNDDDQTDEDAEEESRRWSEWMTTGRKDRRTDQERTDSSEEGSDVPLEELLSSVDKGDDYVVVAVPADKAEGVGPVISSFPGAKLFQRTVQQAVQKKLQKESANNVNGDGVIGNNATSTASSTFSSSSTTVSLGPAPKKKSRKSNKSKKQSAKEEQKLEKEEKQQLLQQQKQREEKHYQEQRERDTGRISTIDWKHNMKNLPSSTILRDVGNPVGHVFVWATFWSVVYRSLSNMAIAKGGEMLGSVRVADAAAWGVRHMTVPTTAHSMMVSAMSLLLVFRTNSAYQRFAEGRKIWEDIVDVARDFSRMLKLYEFAIGTSKTRRITQLLASFPYLLRHRIRPSLLQMRRVNDPNVVRDPENSLLLYPDASLRDTDPEIAAMAYDEEETGSSRRKTRELCWVDKRTLPWKLLPGTALELCARAQNRPLWVCDRMAKELAVVDDLTPKFTNRERMALIEYTAKLSRSIGACERIHQTLVPLNYARHALRSLTVWLWTLPFALVKDLGLLTGPVVAVVSWVLFGVYEIGTRIEDPFQGTLRLSEFCKPSFVVYACQCHLVDQDLTSSFLHTTSSQAYTATLYVAMYSPMPLYEILPSTWTMTTNYLGM
eukprot:scaffold15251_cov214-Alexandrium_tamarense.AAC.3